MDWLEKLLLKLWQVDVPADARLEEWPRLTYRSDLPEWGYWLIVAGIASATLFVYFRERAPVGPVRKVVMAAFRTAAIAWVAFLLLRPILITRAVGARAAPVAVVLDNSQSMTLRDQRISPLDKMRVAIAEDLVAPDFPLTAGPLLGSIPSKTSNDPKRADLVRAVLTNPRLNVVGNLERVGPLRAYLAGQRLRGVAPESAQAKLDAALLADFQADDPRTALADSLAELLQRNEDDLPAAVVLMTDGRDNASKISLAEIAREFGRNKVPLHIYGVGSAEGGNLQLKDAVVADTVFFEDQVNVRVRWRCQGFKQGTADIILTLGGKEVARKEVQVREGDDLIDELKFTPQKGSDAEERHELIANIKFRGPETFTSDNQVKKFIRVTDRKVKVLYVENTPRWEYKFLMPALLRDRRIDAKFLLVQGDPESLKAGVPFLPTFPPTRKELFEFDLVILGDVPASFIGAEQMTWLKDFVSEGGGLILISGRLHAPSSYAATDLAQVLPIEFVAIKFSSPVDYRPQPFSPVLTKAGERSDMLSLSDVPEENKKVWKELPGMHWNYRVEKLRPGAVPLLVHPREMMGDQPMPLAALHYYGKGQVLFLGVEESWRWRSQGEGKYPGRFWGQIIYHMGLPRLLGNLQRVQLALERPTNTVDRPGYVYARLFDLDYKPISDRKVTARLENLDAKTADQRFKTIELDPVQGQPGEYRFLLTNETAGRFKVQMDNPEPATLEYRVDLPPKHELEVAGMAEEALREAATLSGGQFYREEDLHKLATQVKARSTLFVIRQETLLWTPFALVVFVVLLTAEWLVRKFSNLS